MKTLYMLLAYYDGRMMIPLAEVCRDFFSHLTPEKMIRKVNEGDIALPVIRMERSQKSARGVDVRDLADYIDRQREAALKECRQLQRMPGDAA